jgi:hypothetical protein
MITPMSVADFLIFLIFAAAKKQHKFQTCNIGHFSHNCPKNSKITPIFANNLILITDILDGRQKNVNIAVVFTIKND